jgi:hypothetical protein
VLGQWKHRSIGRCSSDHHHLIIWCSHCNSGRHNCCNGGRCSCRNSGRRSRCNSAIVVGAAVAIVVGSRHSCRNSGRRSRCNSGRRNRCKHRSTGAGTSGGTDGSGGADESDGAGASGSTGALVGVAVHHHLIIWCSHINSGRHNCCNSGRCSCRNSGMAGPGNDPVQVYRTGRANHWEVLRLWTGFELPSSCINPPCYALNLNRNIFDFMRWPHIGLGAQDLNGIQRPKYFQNVRRGSGNSVLQHATPEGAGTAGNPIA